MTSEEILKQAQDRAHTLGLPYDGALLPREAYELLQQSKDATLVDVRTRAEWDWVGRIPGAVQIEILTYPGSQPNARFLAELEDAVEKTGPVLFLCRSGGRSHNAAVLAREAGYEAYNVLEGFEGDKDPAGHRNTTGGWRAAGLPWVQS